MAMSTHQMMIAEKNLLAERHNPLVPLPEKLRRSAGEKRRSKSKKAHFVWLLEVRVFTAHVNTDPRV
jgi:hypothetical protein